MRSAIILFLTALLALFAHASVAWAAPLPSSDAVEKRICYGDCRDAIVDPSAAPVADLASSSPSPPSSEFAPTAVVPELVAPASTSLPVPESDSTAVIFAPTEADLLAMIKTMLQTVAAYEASRQVAVAVA